MGITQGFIKVDSEGGKILGLTSDKFLEVSYLWRVGDTIFLSAIAVTAQRQGYLSGLIRRIEELGLQVAVPTPLPNMEAILIHKGFVRTIEDDPTYGQVEIWRRPKNHDQAGTSRASGR